MLEIKNIVKTYKSKSGVTVKALDNVSLKFPKKGMVFILGKSGSGKSTMLNILGGLDGIDSGEILVNGDSTSNFKQAQFDSFRNTYVGFIFQEYNILDNFTVGQNIALAMRLQSRKPTSENINSILKEVELDGLGDRKPNELSGGQKQRVAIARALIKNPQIIMADEPTGALDSATGIQIFDTLKKLSRDKLVIIISHDREFSERYADRIIELKDGKVISDVTNISKNKKIEVSNVVYSANEIYVKNDYVLTAKDLKEINKFLKDCKNGAKIKSGTGKYSVSSRGKFVNTKSDDIQTEKGGFNLIKSRLPLSHAFKMGASGLGHKKFKLGMTIVLSLVAFTMLGASVTVGLTDQNKGIANALASSSYSELNIEKNRYYSSNVMGQRQIYRNNSTYNLTDKDINNIKNIIGDDAILTYRFGSNFSSESTPYFTNVTVYEIEQKLPSSEGYYDNTAYIKSMRRFAEYSSYKSAKEALNKAGYSLLTSDKSFTDSEKPIFVSRHFFNTCAINQAELGGGSAKLNDYDSIVGKTIKFGQYSYGTDTTYKIAGVFDTGFDILDSKYSSYLTKKDIYGNNSVTMEIVNARENDMNSCVVGCYSDFFKDLTNNGPLSGQIKYPTTFSKKTSLKNVSSLINVLSNEFDQKGSEFYRYGINNAMVYTLENTLNNLAPLRIIFLYIGLAFIVFSGLLLANFIANSISYQRKEIGILRAIGARGKDIFKIYGSEAFIIAAANFILSCVSTFVVVKFALAPQIAKITVGVSILNFGIIEALILLGVSFLSAFIASFIPVYKTASKKPVDAIRNK